MLRLCCPFIVPYITHMWKIPVVIPLPKTKDPAEYGDLRPISILPCLSKVIEKIVAEQIRVFLDTNNILPEYQSGFRSQYSCSTALSFILTDILTAIENGETTILVLIDYSKAFDCINHEVLLSILSYIGFTNDAITFFKSYLYNRSKRVKVNNTYSTGITLDSGVPQGSILGPLLYTIYTVHLHPELQISLLCR